MDHIWIDLYTYDDTGCNWLLAITGRGPPASPAPGLYHYKILVHLLLEWVDLFVFVEPIGYRPNHGFHHHHLLHLHPGPLAISIWAE